MMGEFETTSWEQNTGHGWTTTIAPDTNERDPGLCYCSDDVIFDDVDGDDRVMDDGRTGPENLRTRRQKLSRDKRDENDPPDNSLHTRRQ